MTSGLNEGDLVVTSAQFLVDSEANLQDAMKAMSASMPGMDMGGEKKTPQPQMPQQKPGMENMPGMTPPPTPPPAPPKKKSGGKSSQGAMGYMPGMDNMPGIKMPAGKPTKPAPTKPAKKDPKGPAGPNDGTERGL